MVANPILSIIIPFYNVEKYINQCLESIYIQDIPEDYYEVICVNDASPDNSREIVLNFQKNHSNLTIVEHEINKKLGTARNTGRALAKGKYIWNVDSDDMIKLNSLSVIIDECESNDLDVLVFNFDHLRGQKQTVNPAYPFKNSEVLSGIDFLNRYCLGNFSEISPIWTQVYKRVFLENNQIFSPPINMGEDVPFTLKSLLLAKRIKSITNSCYVYRANEMSLGGNIEVRPTAVKLYEKCFICSRLVYELVDLIPYREFKIREEYSAIAKYIVSLFPGYIKLLSLNEFNRFKILCQSNVIRDFQVFKLLNFNYKVLYITKIILNVKLK